MFAPILNTALGWLAHSRLPQTHGELHLPGLYAPVEVVRDRLGIPHIYARDSHDLFFAQGFVHAQDRLWQMEFNRRLVAGRLSEILGSQTVPVDRWMRILTMRRVAEHEVSLLNDEARGVLQAYADGINAFINLRKLPVEFTFLRYRPEPWIIADSLAWVKMMSWSLSVNWETEILRARFLDCLGPDLAAELEPPRPERWPTIVPPGSDYSYIGVSALERAFAARPFTGPSPYEGLGSNNWVVSGAHTATGKPLLANDMHLPISIPAIWYENHLIAGDLNLTGVIFPGLPGIIAGHNGYVAWGLTNGFPDVQDLYMERLRRTDDGRLQVEYNGAWEDVRILGETIQVKGDHPVVEEVVITRHGPIINSLAPDLAGEQPLALRWTSLEPDTMVQGLFDMFRAQNCQQFHQALRQWTAPIQNVVYADTAGNIAYTFPGKVPIRGKGDGRYPVPGWTDEYEWLGYVPYDALPHLYNPPQGFIATANNQAFSNDYPIPIILEPISGDRAQRITQMIQEHISRNEQAKIDISYIQKMHFDQHSPTAVVIAGHIGQIDLEEQITPELHSVVERMRCWDGNLAANSPEAAIYQIFTRKIVRLILSPKLDFTSQNVSHQGEFASLDLTSRWMGKGPTPVLADTSSFGEFWLPWLARLLDQPDSHWFDLGNGETRDDVMRLALQATLDELKEMLGPQVENWAWGKLHLLTYSHVMGANPVLGRFFNRGPYPLGGDHTTIWATGSSYHDLSTTRVIGPPFRMIVDLGDLGNSLGLLAPGQSGNPADPHYDDQAEAWFTAGYHHLLYECRAVEQETESVLHLNP